MLSGQSLNYVQLLFVTCSTVTNFVNAWFSTFSGQSLKYAQLLVCRVRQSVLVPNLLFNVFDRRGLTADNPSVNATSTVPAASNSAGGIHEGTTDTMPGQAPTAAMGGPFGIGAEWQDAVSLVSEDGGSPSLRGDACMAPEKQEHVGEILRRRKGTPAGEKVWGSFA